MNEVDVCEFRFTRQCRPPTLDVGDRSAGRLVLFPDQDQPLNEKV